MISMLLPKLYFKKRNLPSALGKGSKSLPYYIRYFITSNYFLITASFLLSLYYSSHNLYFNNTPIYLFRNIYCFFIFCTFIAAISSISNVISNFSITWTSADTSRCKVHLPCEVLLVFSLIPHRSTVSHLLTSAPIVLCPSLTTHMVYNYFSPVWL